MSDQARADFDRHIDACPPCRARYELERMCKTIVGKKLTMVHTPADVRMNVRDILRGEAKATSVDSAESWIDRLLSNRALAPVLVTGLALIAVFFFLSRPTQVPEDFTAYPSPSDIVQQSMDNFSLIMAGDLKPSMTACSPDSVMTYLHTAGIPFSAKVLRLKDCQSYGAIVNEVNGARLAHIVYAFSDTDILYVYEAAKEEAWKGTSLSLTGEAKQALEETGWYFTTDKGRRNVVLRTINGTLISAVSSMPRDEMMALLTSN